MSLTWLHGFGLIGAVIGVIALWMGLGVLYESTRRRIEDPEFGALLLYSGEWHGWVPFDDHGLVAIRLAGDRDGVPSSARQAYHSFLDHYPDSLPMLVDQVHQEYLGMRDSLEHDDPTLVAIIDADCQDSSDAILDYLRLSLIHIDGDSAVSLEYEVAWDHEHSRAAALDEDLQVRTLSMATAR